MKVDYVAKHDGIDYPISSSGLDTVMPKRVGAETIERAVNMEQGRQTMTITN